MELKNKIIIITGAARGIGAALCRRFRQEQPAAVIAVDLEASGDVWGVDVTSRSEMEKLVERVHREHGRIDVFCSNAGILVDGDEHASPEVWERNWQVNTMAHVTAAQLVLPGMLARGSGCLLQTVSAAGLLTMIGSATYSVTKHAAMAFAEWLSVTYGHRGIQVSALCPLGVQTDLLGSGGSVIGNWLREGALTPDEAADAAVNGLLSGEFLILPHPKVRDYFLNKATDYDRWLAGMRKVQQKVLGV